MHSKPLFLRVGSSIRALMVLGIVLPVTAVAEFDLAQVGRFCSSEEVGLNPFGRLTAGADGMLYGTTLEGVGTVRGSVYRIGKDGSGFRLVHRFGNEAGNGARPYAGLLSGGDGALYGTTSTGGNVGLGTVFRVDPNSGLFELLHSFSGANVDGNYPYAGLLEGSDGALYGTTQFGGSANQGVVFSLRKDGSGYRLLHHFAAGPANGSQPTAELIEGNDRILYGTTHFGGESNLGTVFKLNADGTGFAVLHAFGSRAGDGAHPFGGVLRRSDGVLYGTASSGGSHQGGIVFAMDPNGAEYRVLRHLGAEVSDASRPFAGLFEASDGLLYGATISGGNADRGTLFRIGPDGSGYELILSFTPTDTRGTLPYAGVIELDAGILAGTTWSGGLSSHGTVFRLTLDGRDHAVLHDFRRSADPIYPYGRLLEASDKTLYGTSWTGGASGQGSVFKVRPDGDGQSVIHSPDPALLQGTHLHAGLIEGSDGILYGTSAGGGGHDFGVVFAVNQDGGGYRVLRAFGESETDAAAPYGGLTEGANGVLYGTTVFGGPHFQGTIFRINKDGTGYSLLRGFLGPPHDGSTPYGTLWESGEELYGTTPGGGTAERGTLFRIRRDGGGYRLLRSFSGTDGDGSAPYAGLIGGGDGFLYGLTQLGGQHDHGTVFRIALDGTGGTTLHHFAGAPDDGSRPGAGAALVLGADGYLYGTTYNGGGHDQGTVFRIRTDGGGYGVLHSFDATEPAGTNPYCGLTLSHDGTLYGATQRGGLGCGTLFRIVPVTTLTVRQPGGLLLRGPAGYRYAIEYLDGFNGVRQWQTLTQLLLSEEDREVEDPSSAAAVQRLYRGFLIP